VNGSTIHTHNYWGLFLLGWREIKMFDWKKPTTQHDLGEDIQSISATKIRAKLREDGKLT